MNSPTQTFVNTWVERVDCSTGLPCGVLRDFIQQLSTMPLHTPGLNEREAVGIAAGKFATRASLDGHPPDDSRAGGVGLINRPN